MDIRREEVADALTKFLERYTPPQHMRDKQEAQQAEAELLLKILLRYAPDMESGAWARRVLNVIAERMKTRAWPIPSEIGAAAKEMRQQQKAKPKYDWALDPIKINANRMNNGERVGDEWLYGRRAHQLIESGLVTKDMVESYRYNLFLEEQNTVGEDAAVTRDRERRSSHDKYYSEVVYSLAAE